MPEVEVLVFINGVGYIAMVQNQKTTELPSEKSDGSSVVFYSVVFCFLIYGNVSTALCLNRLNDFTKTRPNKSFLLIGLSCFWLIKQNCRWDHLI